MPYPHYRRPSPPLDLLPRRHCAGCGAETLVEHLAPLSNELPMPAGGIAGHYGLPVCPICRAQQYAAAHPGSDPLPDLTSRGKRTEEARAILGALANAERRLLGEEKW